MNLFKNYEEEFITGLSNINKKIEGISLQNSRIAYLKQIKKNLLLVILSQI